MQNGRPLSSERPPVGRGRRARPPERIDSAFYTAQVMSCPQHCGDLIMPCPFGHFDT